jgi:hypothetical protein
MRKAKGGDDWRVSQQDLEKEKERNISSKEWLRKQNNESLNIQELAEFVQSFYDKDSGTFPKGPEGVAIMVGKKYGEQAEMVARKFVERMAPGQQVPENIDIGDGIVVGGRVVSVSYPDMTGEVVMIDPKMAQRVHVQWDRGGRAEPMQRSKLKAVAAEDIELARIRELSGMPDTGVAEESSGYYYERLAQEVFDNNPNLDTSGRDPEVLNAVFPLLVRDLGSRKKANNLLNYDEDFAADFVSAYGELKKNSGSNESSTMELEAIRRLSGISQGMGF